jgi:opacity protein-like surface antigen
MINKSKLLIIAATIAAFSAKADNHESSYYVGLSGGVSLPLKSKFVLKDEDGEADTRIKKSFMGTVNFGYGIAEGTAIELSVDFKPKYPMSISVDPDKTTGPVKTKATATIFMINVVYDLAKAGLWQPYFVAGLGVADVKLKSGKTFVKSDPTNPAYILENNHRRALAFQLGVGAKYPITEVIQFDVGLKLQGITNVKLKYQTLYKDLKDYPKLKHKSTKQHLGVAEAVAGFVFNF